jgi:hypothetical protein
MTKATCRNYFTKTPVRNLYRHAPSGNYYALLKHGGKQFHRNRETTTKSRVFSQEPSMEPFDKMVVKGIHLFQGWVREQI